jgi:pimeloyl-ACP methyl ester carboxylesterase
MIRLGSQGSASMAVVTTHTGQRIAYVDHGGDGPPVVLLHSFLMDGRMFAPQVDALRDRYRCITIDERGHGDTPATDSFTYWDVAADVIAVLDVLGIPAAVIAGTSQGAFVGMRVALLEPQRVLGLVLMGTSAAAEDPQVAAAYRGLAEVWVQQGPIDPLIDQTAAICFGATPVDEWKARWRTVTGEHLSLILGVLVERDSLLDRLAEISCPVLVLHGDQDAAYPVERAREIADGVKNALPLVVVPGGAHFLSFTDPAEVNPQLEEFLARG